MSDTTDLAALHAAVTAYVAKLRTWATRMSGAPHRDLLNNVANDLASINTNLAEPTSEAFPANGQ